MLWLDCNVHRSISFRILWKSDMVGALISISLCEEIYHLTWRRMVCETRDFMLKYIRLNINEYFSGFLSSGIKWLVLMLKLKYTVSLYPESVASLGRKKQKQKQFTSTRRSELVWYMISQVWFYGKMLAAYCFNNYFSWRRS